MSVELPRLEPLKNDETADVCVVGAGITGLTTAYLLTREGKSVIVLEAREIASGETQRTTAHLSDVIDDRYEYVERVRGSQNARLVSQAHTHAIDQIERICAEEGIACDFQRLEGRLFLAEGQTIEELETELIAVHHIGRKEVMLERTSAIRDFDTGPYLKFPRQAQFHPLKYLRALTELILKRGGKIFAHTRAKNVKNDGGRRFIETENGPTVTAEDFVIATNAPTIDHMRLYAKYAPYRTYAIAASVPKGSIEHALYWDNGHPYHYVRVQKDDRDPLSDILIVGGEDHKTGQADDAEVRYEHLEEWARKRFPMITKVIQKWSGQILETPDGLAFIGHQKGKHEHIYVATGDSGMGLTHSAIAGILLTDLIMGRENPWKDVFDPTRIPPGGMGTVFSENMNVAKELAAGWLKGSDVDAKEQLQPGEGAVMREGLTTKIAVYRDEKGAFHRLSAVCPHKGCIVSWNGGEQTWDCPCHGSRFTATGEVVNGPVYEDLKKVE